MAVEACSTIIADRFAMWWIMVWFSCGVTALWGLKASLAIIPMVWLNEWCSSDAGIGAERAAHRNAEAILSPKNVA